MTVPDQITLPAVAVHKPKDNKRKTRRIAGMHRVCDGSVLRFENIVVFRAFFLGHIEIQTVGRANLIFNLKCHLCIFP